ncbi:uncharacterized protein [Ranitomeya imitator]|uniref:uncharacterized protein n=1 Tax=Ranitomeya imitator TaxID=111125 RepID=UPI0037E71E66
MAEYGGKRKGREEEETPESPQMSKGRPELRSHRCRSAKVSQRDDDRIDNYLLITLVQERVPLWDGRDPQHSVNSTLCRLWSEVAQALWNGWENAPPRVRNAFVEKIRTRWRSMKDRFNKDVRAENRAASGSGARHRLYKYHRVLSFLRPVLLMRTTQHDCRPRFWSGPSAGSHGPVPAIQQRSSRWAFHTHWRPGSWPIRYSPFAVLFHHPGSDRGLRIDHSCPSF